MFAVKYESADGTSQELFEAHSVVHARDPECRNKAASIIEFWTEDHLEAHAPVIFGDIFVMNELGATILIYRLPGPSSAWSDSHGLIEARVNGRPIPPPPPDQE